MSRPMFFVEHRTCKHLVLELVIPSRFVHKNYKKQQKNKKKQKEQTHIWLFVFPHPSGWGC